MRMMISSSRRWALLALGAVLATSLGCAQQVGDIDRVQANALRKSDFLDGEWYIRQTFTEVPPASYASFVGLTGDLEKIRWEITEDYLIAYRSYNHNPGSHRSEVVENPDGTLTYGEGEQEGYSDEYKESPIAAYPISGHFDVQRSYNTSTGEQNNVIVENSSDRLWYEREWFRVDWENVLTTQQMFDNYFFSGLSFYVQSSEQSPDALQMEYFDPSQNIPGISSDDYEEGELYYMDFTNRIVLDPGYSYCFGLFYPQALDDCAASEVETRTSLLRVPRSSDYEPIYYDDIDQQKFGYFRTERLVYDDRRGESLSNQILLGNRHNIWSNTWQRDEAGNVLLDAEGRALPRPFAARTPEPVVYHVSPNYPEALWGATQAIGDDWDRSLRRTVAVAQGLCDVAADGRRTCHPEQVRRMYYVCHNPVLQEDPEECGEVGLSPRAGDLRYNFIYWVDLPQAAGPLGYGPSSADPETGEIIAGQAFVYGAAVDTYAEYGLDIVRFLNGDLEFGDIQDSQYIRDELLARNDPNIDPRGMLDSRLANIRIDDLNIQDMIPERGRTLLQHIEEHGLNDFVARPEWTQHRFDMIAESGVGALAVDDEVLHNFGVSQLSELPDEIRSEYFRGGALLPRVITEGRERRLDAAAHNVWLSENLDDTIVGLAMQYRGRTDYENIWQEIRSSIYRGVQSHEVGHTMGLRHNFQGSYDSLNYFDRYWELKTAGVPGVTQSGEVGVVPFQRPQYLTDIYGMAQMTPAQVEGRMREYQYSSIMDYHSAFNMDWQGIGKYDEAAIIYAYTSGRDRTVSELDPSHPLYNTQERGYVEVFNDVGSARDMFNSVEGLDNPAYPELLELYHYSTVATAMGSTPEQIQANIRSRSLLRYGDLLNAREADVAGRPVEVPYLFLSDYWVGASQTARAWDQGADPLEQSLNMIDRYRTYYPFTYFRRDRAGWYPSSILDRLAGRYFVDLIDNYQRWLFDVAIQGGRPDPVIDNGWTFGAYASLNLMAEVMTTPSYGSYSLDSEDNTYYLSSYGQRSDSDLYIPQGEGRRPYSRYDVDLGYNYWVWPTEAGHFWAYYAATIMMSSSSSLAVRGADVDADFLTYSIPPYLVFEDEMTRLFNGLWTENNRAVAPAVARGSDGQMELQRRLFAPIPLQGGDLLDPETGFVASSIMDSRTDVDPGPLVDVQQGFTYSYLPLLYGMAFFDTNFSLHFHDQARIFRLGSGETLTPGEGYEAVQFCDPFAIGGICYAALMQDDTDDPGAAARLILETQALYDEDPSGNQFIIENNVEKMNMMRGLYDLFANPWN